MIFASYFPGCLEFFADALSVEAPDDTGPVIEGHELISGTALSEVLPLFAASRDIGARRATATDWSKYFFARLIVPVVVIENATGCALDLSPGGWRIHCREDGTVSRFVFRRDPLSYKPDASMASLIDEVMTPLIALLAGDCGLSSRVFTSNAAMYYAWAVTQLDQQCGRPSTPACRAVLGLLEAPQRGDGGYNPFHNPFKALPPGSLDGNGEPIRVCRRLCCVRDLEPSLGLCTDCPRAITYAGQTAPAM